MPSPRFASSLVALLAFACDDAPAGQSVEVGLAGLTLRVPDGEVTRSEQGVEVDFRPGRRQPKFLSVRRSVSEKSAAAPRHVQLGAAGTLRYRIDRADVGSGGPEARLVGRIAVGERELEVECGEQAETAPSLEWCLNVLRTLR